jgi:hypothetical protein
VFAEDVELAIDLGVDFLFGLLVLAGEIRGASILDGFVRLEVVEAHRFVIDHEAKVQGSAGLNRNFPDAGIPVIVRFYTQLCEFVLDGLPSWMSWLRVLVDLVVKAFDGFSVLGFELGLLVFVLSPEKAQFFVVVRLRLKDGTEGGDEEDNNEVLHEIVVKVHLAPCYTSTALRIEGREVASALKIDNRRSISLRWTIPDEPAYGGVGATSGVPVGSF